MPGALAPSRVVESHINMEGSSTVAEESPNENIVVKEEVIEDETQATVDVWHRCLVCAEKFQAKISLLVHLANYHAVSEQFKRMSGEPDPGNVPLCAPQTKTLDSAPAVTQPWICEVCLKLFTHKSSLRQHRSGIHQSARPITEPINWIGSGPMPPPRKKILAIDPNAFRGGLPCSLCSVLFLDQAALEQHHISHWSAERLWKCEVCNLPVTRMRSLVVHRKSKHGLTNQLTEKTHKYQRQHDDSATKPILLLLPANLLLNQSIIIPTTVNNSNLNCLLNSHACPECNCTFVTGSHLETHMFTHSALRWWACEACPALFKQQIDLKRHRVVRHQLMDQVTEEIHRVVGPRESSQQTPAQQELVKSRVKQQEAVKQAQIRLDGPKILQEKEQLQQQPEPESVTPKIGREKKKSTKSAVAANTADETAGSRVTTTTIVQVENSQDKEDVSTIERKSPKPTEKVRASKRPRVVTPIPIAAKPPSVSTYQARGIQWSCCALCPAMFATEKALKEHREVKHGQVDSSAVRRSKRLKK